MSSIIPFVTKIDNKLNNFPCVINAVPYGLLKSSYEQNLYRRQTDGFDGSILSYQLPTENHAYP